MGNFIIIAVLVVILALALKGTIRRIRFGSSCCGEREPGEKRIKVKDKNKDNYPYTYVLKVDGMHCANCARRVENALNSLEGRWAVVDFGNKEVLLRSKIVENEAEVSKVISSAGYTMLSCVAGERK